MSRFYIITGMRRRICGRYVLFGILGFFSIVSFLPSFEAFADNSLYDNANQEDYLLEISPASRRMSFKSGEQKKESLQIKNVGRKAVVVDVYAAAYSPEDSDVNQGEELASEYTKLAEWMKFKDSNDEYHHKISFTLHPNQIREVRYSVDVPKEAVGGGQYAIVFAELTPTKQEEGAFVARSRLGMSLFAFVDGADIIREGQVDNIKVDGVLIDRKIGVEYAVKNNGNIDFQASNDMTVSSIFGKELYHNIFVKTILPGSSKTIHDEWEEAPGFGLFRLKYKVIALNDVEEGERVVIVIPAGGLGLILLLIVAGVIVARYLKIKMTRERRAKMV